MPPNMRTQELNLKQFEIRKAAKLCICFVCFFQILYRISAIIWSPSVTPRSILMMKISLPFSGLMIAMIALEYFLFKKKGSRVAKYSNIVDFILLMLFLLDWIAILRSSIYETEQIVDPSLTAIAVVGLTSFSWRTLLVTLFVQKWQLKIIAPMSATFMVTGFAASYSQGNLLFLLLRAALQALNILLIIYCTDKVAWKLMRTNFEQEKWMQVNNFILDSIPEKIMILDLSGEVKFLSEYCKAYLTKLNLSVDASEFFKRVRDLQPQPQYEFDPLNVSTAEIEIPGTWNELEAEPNISFLQDLITNFPNLIRSRNLQERQFLVYNGKFETKIHHTEKSLEMKISFVQHYKNNYMILILKDMTQRDLLVTLEETNKYKDELLASVSHELRAPLNGNINLVEGALNSPKIPKDIKETLLTPALQSSKFLLHIINDIIDMSQIKQKKLRLVFQSGDLKETLRNTAQLVELQARKKGLDFLIEIDGRISQNFCTDHLRVSQIVLNLLTNAVKFTNHGMIKLIAVPLGNRVKISVEDSGIGISQLKIQKLFSSKSIIECQEKEKLNPTGAGLGLNIASNLIEFLAPENQKTINVVSSLNEGSTFEFFLENKPAFDRSDSDSMEKLIFIAPPKIFEKINTLASPCSSSSDLERFESQDLSQTTCLCAKVLIVDDNPFNTMALETILNSLEIKSDSAYNGPSALQKLLHRQKNTCGKDCRQYSVVFMDQEMPGLSGNETVQEIKKLQEENQVSSDIRIIGCTAHKGKEEVDRFLASGLENCIFKPVSIAIIKDTLGQIFY